AGHSVELTRDEQGNITQERTPDWSTYRYTFDSNNNQTSSTTPNGTTSTFDYDGNGNLVGTARPDPDGGDPITTSLARDPVTGLVTAATDE
uniref:RHS repeat domain-containing protein n=1 Tax=Xanthomonas sp. WCS2017Noco2-62 TaxID=3073640 RepID=UPI00288B3871